MIKKKVIKHLKGDIKTFKHEAAEDRELMRALKKSPEHKRRKHHSKRPESEKEEHRITAMPMHHHTKVKHHSTKESPKAKHFIEKRMHEFKEGKMHSRKHKTGPLVTNPKQAIAIALSESRKKGMKVSRKK